MDRGQDRVTIREAAARFGVTEAAIRKRIQRGSLDRELGEDGRAYVYLDVSQDMSNPESQVDGGALVQSLHDQITYLRSQLDVRAEEIQRRDVIISQLTQANATLAARVPELEAAQEPSERAGGVADSDVVPGYPASRTEDPRSSRPWWRRMFGG